MKKTTIFAAFLAVFAFAPVNLQADTVEGDIIKNWDFSVESSFVSWLGPKDSSTGAVTWQDAATHVNLDRSGKTPGNTVGDEYGKDSTLSWSSYDSTANNSSGVAGHRTSGLELDSNSGTIATDGEKALALTMIHNNQTVGTTAPTPKIMEIVIDVLLTGTHAGGQTVEEKLTMTLLLGFIETPNKGHGMLSGHTEDDIFFVISNPSTTQQFTDAFGNKYDVSMDAVFEQLTGEHLVTGLKYAQDRIGGFYDLGKLDTLYGWSTKENTYEANTMNVNIVVRHDTMENKSTTPEPATMLIFAVAGAVGIPAYRRMKKQARS